MDMETVDRELINPEKVNIPTNDIYRGFRIKKEYWETLYSIEVSGFNLKGNRLIGLRNTYEEAYENLIGRIDTGIDA